MRFRLSHSVILAAALALAACSTQISVCPLAVILADAASVTQFKPGTVPDLSNEMFTVALVNAQTNCSYAKKAATTSSALDLTFRATRPPSGESATYSVPYFVVVHEADRVLDKKIYTLRFTFAPGATSATITQSPQDILIKIENGKLPWNYQLLSGLQVTPAQIDYNKKMGRYVP